jgi:hypothetical protein
MSEQYAVACTQFWFFQHFTFANGKPVSPSPVPQTHSAVLSPSVQAGRIAHLAVALLALVVSHMFSAAVTASAEQITSTASESSLQLQVALVASVSAASTSTRMLTRPAASVGTTRM